MTSRTRTVRLVSCGVLLLGVGLLNGGCGSCSQKGETAAKPESRPPEREEPMSVKDETSTAQPSSSRPKKVRPAALAGGFGGGWYPSSPTELRRSIEAYLKQAGAVASGRPMALIAPHAGHRWSGQTAAYAYKTVEGKAFRRVFVLAPNHSAALQGAAVPSATAFATPLGEVPVDTEVTDALAQLSGIAMDDRPHATEHAIEIHLPFLQVALQPGYLLVPVMVGQMGVAEAKELAEKLRPYVGSEDLMIASSDFTHYGARFGYLPFETDIPNKLKELDFGALEQIRKLSPEGLAEYKRKTGITVCGSNPIVVLLALMPKNSRVELLKYDTSGRQTDDYSNSVSYLSIALTGDGWPKSHDQADDLPEVVRVGGPEVLTPREQQMSLKLARAVVEEYVRNRRTLRPEDIGIEASGNLVNNYGVFVTLKRHDMLRGCIGNIWPHQRFIDGLIGRAVDAAANDRRFAPVKPEELKDLEVEVSVLTKPHAVPGYQDIQIGKHGIVLSKEGQSAVFLPQVAPEQGWNLEQTLTHLARKARLPADAWRKHATFEVFEAQVFKEAEE